MYNDWLRALVLQGSVYVKLWKIECAFDVSGMSYVYFCRKVIEISRTILGISSVVLTK